MESNVVICGNETDILVILLAHVQFTGDVWMHVGHNYNNTWQYIDATTLAKHLGLIMCETMPGFHICTGSYYTSTFFKQGKIRPSPQWRKV